MTTKKRTSKSASEPKTVIKKSVDFKSFYANWAQAASSPFDVVVNFGEASPDNAGGLEIEQKARIVFSPLEAKMVAYILTKTLRDHEAKFGEIAVPSQVALQLRQLSGSKEKEIKEITEGA